MAFHFLLWRMDFSKRSCLQLTHHTLSEPSVFLTFERHFNFCHMYQELTILTMKQQKHHQHNMITLMV